MISNILNKIYITFFILGSAFILLCSDYGYSRDAAFFETQLSGIESNKNIIEKTEEFGNFGTFLAAVKSAGLEDILKSDGPFTVFAPTDEAFELIPEETIEALLKPENRTILTDILIYHVYPGKILEKDIMDIVGSSIAMLNMVDLNINTVEGDVILNQDGKSAASVIITDILCKNGVIHVVDVVLDPNENRMDIVDTAAANGNFTTLITALKAAGLDDDLRGLGPFTVFAPTDNAFALITDETIEDLLKPENQSTLIEILTYHVYSGKLFSPNVLDFDGSEITMLGGGEVNVDVMGNNLFLNFGGNKEARVVITDIIALNGIIHLIDVVLDPNDQS